MSRDAECSCKLSTHAFLTTKNSFLTFSHYMFQFFSFSSNLQTPITVFHTTILHGLLHWSQRTVLSLLKKRKKESRGKRRGEAWVHPTSVFNCICSKSNEESNDNDNNSNNNNKGGVPTNGVHLSFQDSHFPNFLLRNPVFEFMPPTAYWQTSSWILGNKILLCISCVIGQIADNKPYLWYSDTKLHQPSFRRSN